MILALSEKRQMYSFPSISPTHRNASPSLMQCIVQHCESNHFSIALLDDQRWQRLFHTDVQYALYLLHQTRMTYLRFAPTTFGNLERCCRKRQLVACTG